MPATKGRNVTLTWNGVAITGMREKSISLNGEAINVTSDEDNGWQALLAEAAENSVEITVSGVTKTTAIKNDWWAGTRTRTAVYTWPDGSSLSGSYMITAYSEGAPYNDAVTYELTLSSTGAMTYTPA